MSLQLYDTRTREVRAFSPVVPGKASIYYCGPTVQAPPHIGHVRSAINFDILRRWLTESGYDVTMARNVTDVDDKIISTAADLGIPWWELADQNTRAFNRAYDLLNVLPPSVEPRATGHITQILELISILIDRGHAYAAGGDVYFDVRSHPTYGSISGQDPDNLQVTEQDGPKRSPLDFALWKGAKPGEPSWPSPWGAGRPGWHIECSAMAAAYLGDTFDIHGGGIDLVFPHHENETAQSEAAGHGFARWWMHNGMVNIGAEKMSKSLGNSLLVEDVAMRYRPVVLRYALGSAHYRSRIDWSEATLDEADAAYSRIETFLRNSTPEGGLETAEAILPPQTFYDAMNDDLAVPQALAAVHNVVRDGNTALASGDRVAVRTARKQVQYMLQVLGLEDATRAAAALDLTAIVDSLIDIALEARADARERKDWAQADAIRDQIAAAGITVEDTPDGARWRLADKSEAD